MNKQIEEDKEILLRLGGYSSVARLIGVVPQRVFNWSKRGIPSKMKLDYPELFLKNNGLKEAELAKKRQQCRLKVER